MPLHPQARQLLERAAAAGLAPLHTLSVAEARARMHTAFATVGEREPVHRVEEHRVPVPGAEIGLRLFRPGPESVLPAVLFFHGGGWVLNSVETHDALCRSLANLSGAAVLSVDYRLAPEHKYPAAVDDAWAATRWCVEHAGALGLDAGRLAVAGDSAGATLAAVVTLLARGHSLPLAAQVLAYPVTDHWAAGTRSYAECATGYSLGRDTMVWFWDCYLCEPADLDDPTLCPLRAPSMDGLPPALIVTAGCDPLRDEGEAYARRLHEAGGVVEYECLHGQMHGFLMQTRLLDEAREALGRIAAFLRGRLTPAARED